MKNMVFISPNFPENYWHFCDELKKNGFNVLGIGDCPYDNLTNELKGALTEYYKVSSLENYDEVFRAVAFFAYKYGKIDWLESNNEYWLEKDAKLRTEFNITTGFKEEDILKVKCKSSMKQFYEKAGIPAARYHLVKGWKDAKEFIAKVGYPVIVKPDNGVGASNTFKLKSDADLQWFLDGRLAEHDTNQYIMEEFITGEICSYDAIINSQGEPIFETGNRCPIAIMDIVNNQDNTLFYIQQNLPEDTRAAGRAAVKAFGVKSRFIHFEFFRLTADMEGLGKKGQVVALEVNMRPSGGFTPDMINFAHSTNVYKIWADMVAFDSTMVAQGPHYHCVFAGRRNGRRFKLDHDAFLAKYCCRVKMHCPTPPALADAMSDYMYLVLADDSNLDELLADAVNAY